MSDLVDTKSFIVALSINIKLLAKYAGSNQIGTARPLSDKHLNYVAVGPRCSGRFIIHARNTKYNGSDSDSVYVGHDLVRDNSTASCCHTMHENRYAKTCLDGFIFHVTWRGWI